MFTASVPLPTDAIADLCRRHGITRVDMFGSALREDFDPARSDIDLLVEFAPDRDLTFFDLPQIEDDFAMLFGGRRVDLVFRDSLNRWIRQGVLAEAKTLYVAPR